jgi:hypothetical protein
MSWFVGAAILIAAGLLGERAGRLALAGRFKLRWAILFAFACDAWQLVLWGMDLVARQDNWFLLAGVAVLGMSVAVVLKDRVPEGAVRNPAGAPARVR